MGQIFRSEHSVFAPVAEAMQFAPASEAEALKLLRESYPDRPLSGRLAALAFLMRRQSAGA